MKDQDLYTPRTKSIISQLCRYRIATLPKVSMDKWKELLSDLLNNRLPIDIFIKNDEPRLIMVRETGEYWQFTKIVDDLLYLTNGEREISENMFICETNKLEGDLPCRLIRM